MINTLGWKTRLLRIDRSSSVNASVSHGSVLLAQKQTLGHPLQEQTGSQERSVFIDYIILPYIELNQLLIMLYILSEWNMRFRIINNLHLIVFCYNFLALYCVLIVYNLYILSTTKFNIITPRIIFTLCNFYSNIIILLIKVRHIT